MLQFSIAGNAALGNFIFGFTCFLLRSTLLSHFLNEDCKDFYLILKRQSILKKSNIIFSFITIHQEEEYIIDVPLLLLCIQFSPISNLVDLTICLCQKTMHEIIIFLQFQLLALIKKIISLVWVYHADNMFVIYIGIVFMLITLTVMSTFHGCKYFVLPIVTSQLIMTRISLISLGFWTTCFLHWSRLIFLTPDNKWFLWFNEYSHCSWSG